MGNYVVYLIIYSGEKHPPFYIGSTSRVKLEKGYRGSVKSLRWKDIYKTEVKENPGAYTHQVLASFYTREEALQSEKEFQLLYNAVKSDLFVNRSLASEKGFFGANMEGMNNPMYGRNISDKTKEALSRANSGKVTVTEDGMTYFKVSVEDYDLHKERYSTPRGEFKQATTDATIERVKLGCHHFQDKDVIARIQEKRISNGFKHSDEVKDRISNLAKERLKDWCNKNLNGSESLWRIAPNLFEYFENNELLNTKSWRKALISDWVRNFPILEGRNKWMFKLAAKFKNGWVPVNDKSFMNWIQNEST